MHAAPQTKAFSLVELSIVLVILGLLVGGILAGQSLIRASQLRAVSTEFNFYTTALMSFRDKYLNWPGDMPNATAFWGAANNGNGKGDSCFSLNVSTLGGKTCNGTGDGYISDPGGVSANYVGGETFHAFVQMANAGLINGTYTGVAATTSPSSRVPGLNMPASKIPNQGISIQNDPTPDTNYFFSNITSLSVYYLSLSRAYNGSTELKPEEAWNIDTKMDDGKPALGRMLTQKKTSIGTPNCPTSDAYATAEYDVTNTSKLCQLYWRFY